MRALSLYLSAIVLVLLSAGSAIAQSEQTPRYRVEIVLFEQTSPEAFKAETWPQDVPPVDMDGTIDVLAGQSTAGFHRLMNSALQLDDAVQRLNESDRYHVILHRAWEQPGLDDASARQVAIHAGEDYAAQFPQLMMPRWEYRPDGSFVEVPGPEKLQQVTGWIKVVLGRYLHVYTDLRLLKPVVSRQILDSGEVVEVPDLYTIEVAQHRRMRSRELHYLDHPLLGVLVEITPVENGQ